MKTHYTLLLLLALIALSFCLRVIPPYDHVFTSEWIKFVGYDVYWQMAQVNEIAPVFPEYAGKILEIRFFHWLLAGTIWVIGLGSPTQHTIDTVAVYFPAVLGALAVVPVYFLGKAMFGQGAGIMAALLIAILPGEFLGRSSLGYTDHHVLEVLLTTTALLFVVMAVKASSKSRIIYGLLAGLFFGLYWLTWAGAVLFGGILAVYMLVYLVSAQLRHRPKAYLNIIGIIVAGGVTVWLFLVRIIPEAFLGPTAITVMELAPLDLFGAWRNFGIITFLVPVILAFLVYKAVKHWDASTILLLVWSAVMLVSMMEYRRYAYYFTVNASLLTGWLVWYVWNELSKRDLPKAIAVTAVLCALIIFPNIQQATAVRAYHTPPDVWYETLTWVKDNTPEDSLVLAWWDYGYWIEYIADRNTYVRGGVSPEEVAETARFFLSSSGISSIHYDYLILDYEITTIKFKTISVWADKQVEVYSPQYYQSLLVRLYTGEVVYPYLLVYQSEQKIGGISEVKVFYRRQVIDGQ